MDNHLNSRVDERLSRLAHNQEIAGSNPAPAPHLISRRLVAVKLPVALWGCLEAEADFRNANLSAHVSDLICCALNVQGYDLGHESMPDNYKRKEISCG